MSIAGALILLLIISIAFSIFGTGDQRIKNLVYFVAVVLVILLVIELVFGGIGNLRLR